VGGGCGGVPNSGAGGWDGFGYLQKSAGTYSSCRVKDFGAVVQTHVGGLWIWRRAQQNWADVSEPANQGRLSRRGAQQAKELKVSEFGPEREVKRESRPLTRTFPG